MVQGSLGTYNRKRNFRATPEPPGKAGATRGAGVFVVQKHAASRLHYDFRLEWDGVLRSWAVPKGPSLDPSVKRMAVQVEDHPLSYGDFEGIIPEGQYGAGSVVLWDTGRWTPIGDAARGLREGKLKFTLDGRKLQGGFTLVRLRQRDNERQPAWLLIKEKDDHARATRDFDVLEQMAGSVKPAPSPRRSTRAKARGLPLPPLLSPQLATLVSAPPSHGEWLYELKLDGYRLLARVDGGDVRCFTRNGNDWSGRVQPVVDALKALKLPPCWLDGELVAMDPQGVPDFQRLQNSFEHHAEVDLRYIVFDLLFLAGEDLRAQAQRARSARVAELLEPARRHGSIIQPAPVLQEEPRRLLAAARAAGFEGLVGKRADATYRSGRSRDWVKLKAGRRQEFVIGGFTDPQGSRKGLGSLLLGVHDEDGALRYVGNVGSGFDEQTLRTLHAKLTAIQTSTSPFRDPPQRVGSRRLVPHWVKPRLVAEVSFAGWTTGASVRHAVFHGLRDDKPPQQITMERARPPEAVEAAKPMAGAKGKAKSRSKVPRRKTAAAEDLRVTHPERVIDAGTGITKGDLVAYYAAVASLMLPHLQDRPVAMLREPVDDRLRERGPLDR